MSRIIVRSETFQTTLVSIIFCVIYVRKSDPHQKLLNLREKGNAGLLKHALQ